MSTITAKRVCKLCYALLQPLSTTPRLRTFSTSRPYNSIDPTNNSPSSSTSSSTSSTSSNFKAIKSLQTLRLEQLQSQLTQLLRSAKTKSGTTIKSWELERKLGEVGGKINKATGYEEIERLRSGVSQKGKPNCRYLQNKIS